MPALEPRCAIAVSQLPRWPMVSLSLSWAEAGEAAESSAAATNATASWWIRVITVSLRSGEINRLGSAHYPVEPQCETGHSTAGLNPLASRQMVYMSLAHAGSFSPCLNGSTSNYFAMGAPG